MKKPRKRYSEKMWAVLVRDRFNWVISVHLSKKEAEMYPVHPFIGCFNLKPEIIQVQVTEIPRKKR